MDQSAENLPVVELRGIKKHFGAVSALRGVDLVLNRHEVLGLMGDNAAGKSTLMKVLSGAYVPNEGKILVDGQEVNFALYPGTVERVVAVEPEAVMRRAAVRPTTERNSCSVACRTRSVLPKWRSNLPMVAWPTPLISASSEVSRAALRRVRWNVTAKRCASSRMDCTRCSTGENRSSLTGSCSCPNT